MRWTMVLLAPIMSRALNLLILVVLLLGTTALGVSIEAWRRATWRHVAFRGDRLLVSTVDGRVEESDVVFDAAARAVYNASRPFRETHENLTTTGAFLPNVTIYLVRQGIFRHMLAYQPLFADPTGPGAIELSLVGHNILDAATDLPYAPGERIIIYGGGSGANRLFLSTTASDGSVKFGWVGPTNTDSYPYPYFSGTNSYVQGRSFRMVNHHTDWHATSS